jgi:hypothetical protein
MLDVSKNTVLWVLNCNDNQLSALDVSKNTALEALWCDNNQLSALDVTKNTALRILRCDNNQLKSLDVSKNTGLLTLYSQENQLTALDVSNNTALEHLDCSYNYIPSTGDVKGWQEIGLILNETFFFDPQNVTPIVPITSLKIDAASMVSLPRNSTMQLNVIVNEGASTDGIEWSVSDTSFATVNSSGFVIVSNKTGAFVLTVKDPVSGITHSVVLRIN